MSRVIDLSVPDGNAYALMGYARKWAKERGLDPQPILADMMAGDYMHLLGVMDREFDVEWVNDPRQPLDKEDV